MPAAAPLQTLVAPARGSYLGGEFVTITGANFVATPTVTFGGVAATSVVWVSATTLTCLVPAHAVGAVNVVVTNPDAQVCTATLLFIYVSTQWELHRFDLRMRKEQTS